MPKTVKIEKSTRIAAPFEKVWTIAATDFEHIARWDANVRSSAATTEIFSGAPVSGRVCKMYNGGTTTEKIIEFDESERAFTYEIVSGLPGFVVAAQNRWKIESLSPTDTKVTMTIAMSVKGMLGTIMQTPMKSQMGKVLQMLRKQSVGHSEGVSAVTFKSCGCLWDFEFGFWVT